MLPALGTPALVQGRRVLIIHNPTAGRRRRRHLALVLARLEQLGCHVVTRETQRRGDAERFVREAVEQDWDVVAAAGGDGTVNEMVNGLAGAENPPMLAIIPMGTANVLACEIGLDPKDAEQVANTIAFGATKQVRLGIANSRHFVLMAGAGLDARVVEGINLHSVLKRCTGKMAYVVEGVRQALGYDFPALEIRADGQTYCGRMAVACKGRHYGGPFVAAPEADLGSSSLEICILPNKGVAGMLRYGLALPLGQLSRLPEVQMVSAQSLTITGPRGAPVQADGDIIARLPAEIAVSQETVQLVMPSKVTRAN